MNPGALAMTPAELFDANTALAYWWVKRLRANPSRRELLQARGFEREDLEQEALIALYRAARDFDATRGFSFSTFAIVCIRHALANLARRGGRLWESLTALPAAPLLDRVADDPEEFALAAERQAWWAAEIRRRIERLPPATRRTVEALAAGRRKVDIARELGITSNGVQMHCRTARQHLRDLRPVN